MRHDIVSPIAIAGALLRRANVRYRCPDGRLVLVRNDEANLLQSSSLQPNDPRPHFLENYVHCCPVGRRMSNHEVVCPVVYRAFNSLITMYQKELCSL